MDDTVTLICPNLSCRRTVVAPAKARGKIVRCAHCNELFRVPEAQTSAGRGREQRPEQPNPKKKGR